MVTTRRARATPESDSRSHASQTVGLTRESACARALQRGPWTFVLLKLVATGLFWLWRINLTFLCDRDGSQRVESPAASGADLWGTESRSG
jgi:hypothetical protein